MQLICLFYIFLIMPDQINKVFSTVDHLFRLEYAKLVSILARRYGTQNIDIIENAVQDALLKAMQMWPYAQQPENPTAWLFSVANNGIIDQLRRVRRQSNNDDMSSMQTAEPAISPQEPTNDFEDEQLNLIFACCHPALKPADQIMLSLKLLCGFSVHEIGRALLKKDEAVKKAISRAKQVFRVTTVTLEPPASGDLTQRLDSVLKVLYLMFNEGYKSTGGENLLNREMCEDAIRLGLMLRKNDRCNTDELSALLALMCFNTARFTSRQNGLGELQTLEYQDRDLWDKDYLKMGVFFLSESSAGAKLSRYHIEAGIASHYSLAKSYEKTDWCAILFLYDQLIQHFPSPAAFLNRIVVVQKCHGASAALDSISEICKRYDLESNHLFHSIKSDIFSELGEYKKARTCLREAIARAENVVEKQFLQNKYVTLPAEK